MVNELTGDRTPDPQRMLRAYHTAASTLNLLRAYAAGGGASLDRVHAWNAAFARSTDTGARYDPLASEIDRAVRFMRACGVRDAALESVELYASHEALILEYERALTRIEDGRPYDLSGHFVWVGERTRQMDGGHLDFVSRLANPIGIKLGPSATPEFAAEVVERLDPDGVPGRLTLITRMGNARVRCTATPRRRAPGSRPGTSTGSSTKWTGSSTYTPSWAPIPVDCTSR
jgi:3-deoxy-7-phosphoheptulonate synthase